MTSRQQQFPARLGDATFYQAYRKGDEGDGRLQLVLPSGNHLTIAAHHRVEALLGDVSGIAPLFPPDFRVEHVGGVRPFAPDEACQ
jgi:hypothetical protein